MKHIKLIIRVVRSGKFRGMIDIFYAEIESNSKFTCFDKYGHSDASCDYFYQDTRAARGNEIAQGEFLIKKVFNDGDYKIVKKIIYPSAVIFRQNYFPKQLRGELLWT